MTGRNLNVIRIWGFIGKIDSFFPKKILKSFKIATFGNFFRMRLKCYFFLKMSFDLIYEVLGKIRKSLQLEKFENLMVLKKERFRFSKWHLVGGCKISRR